MSWDARPGRKAGLGAFLILSLGVVVSCTSISIAAPPTAVPTAPPIRIAASTPEPTPVPTLRPTPMRTATPMQVPLPSPSVSPSSAIATAAGPGALTKLNQRTRRKIRKILETQTGAKGIAGLSIAIGLPNGEIWAAADGSAEFSPSRPIQEETVFAVASVTKTFIAALILALAEEGKLSLEEPFGTYEPLAPRGRKVSIRQLLSHTSGIYNYFENREYGQIFKERGHRWTYEEIISLVRPGYCKPGTCYHYSNTNFVILGAVAEATGGAPLHEQLRERFFDPLRMDSTIYQPFEATPLDAAHGHWRRETGGYIDHTRGARVIPFMSAASVASSAGAIASTASDLATWARALYGGEVLSRASIRQMTSFLPDGTYGLGTDVASFAGKRAVGHRGSLRGFESSMWFFPREGVSIALLSNHGNWLTDVPFERIAKAAFSGR